MPRAALPGAACTKWLPLFQVVVPAGYERNFKQALVTFLHQRVWSPEERCRACALPTLTPPGIRRPCAWLYHRVPLRHPAGAWFLSPSLCLMILRATLMRVLALPWTMRSRCQSTHAQLHCVMTSKAPRRSALRCPRALFSSTSYPCSHLLPSHPPPTTTHQEKTHRCALPNSRIKCLSFNFHI